MECDRCGRQASDADRFCAGCGSALTPAASAESAGAVVHGEAPLTPLAPVGSPAAVPVYGADVPPPPLPVLPSLPGEPHRATAYEAPSFAVPTPRATEPSLPYAGFWRRLVALALDALLLFFPQAILRVLMGLPVLSYDDEWGDKTALTAELFGVALTVLYCATLEASGGQGSLGQQMLGLTVTDTHGRRIGFGRALTRQFSKLLSTLLCGMGYLLQLWNGKRQTLHDMICGTLVLRQAPEGDRDSREARMVVAS